MTHEAPKSSREAANGRVTAVTPDYEFIIDSVDADQARHSVDHPAEVYPGFVEGERITTYDGPVTRIIGTTEIEKHRYPASLTLSKAENLGQRALAWLHLRKPKIARVYRRHLTPSEDIDDKTEVIRRAIGA
jgi:hypothetical protein